MQSKVKSNSVVTSRHDPERGAIVFAVVGAGETALMLNQISEAVRARAVIHGLTQRISDRAAIGRDPANGLPATPGAKLARMATLVDHLNTGTEEWSPAVESKGPGYDPLLVAAIMEALGRDRESTLAFIEAGAVKNNVTPRAYLARLGASKVAAPIVARMQAALASDVDPDAEMEAGMMPADEEPSDAE